MLINDAKTGEDFTYKALLLSGDDDGIGLVFGYKDSANFYRIMFCRARGAQHSSPVRAGCWNKWWPARVSASAGRGRLQ